MLLPNDIHNDFARHSRYLHVLLGTGRYNMLYSYMLSLKHVGFCPIYIYMETLLVGPPANRFPVILQNEGDWTFSC